MPSPKTPRSGSMQFWPRKRAKRIYPRVRHWKPTKNAGLLGFAGYKAGMTHVTYNDTAKFSRAKGEEVTCPVTVLECPPLKIAAVRFYAQKKGQRQPVKEVMVASDKDLSRKIVVSKQAKKLDEVKPAQYDDLTLLVYTQPKLVGLKKKPELFELPLAGTKEEKRAFVEEHLNKPLTIDMVFKEGALADAHGITKGKGFQGPVKRFGIDLKRHKSEKTRRNPGAIGVWDRRYHMYRVPHAGQMGFQQRVDYNKKVLKIANDPEAINPEGGFIRYGLVKNTYILLKGSLSGPKKRLIFLSHAAKAPDDAKEEAPQITYTSTRSKQGR